jgi:predicted DNA-binding protein
VLICPRMRAKENRFTELVSFRMSPAMLDRIERMAVEDGRTLASMIRTLVRWGIEKVEQKEAGR